MSKYINADTVIQALKETIDRFKDDKMFTRTVRAAENMIRIIDRSYGERKESKVKKCFDIPIEVAKRLLEDMERKETDD